MRWLALLLFSWLGRESVAVELRWHLVPGQVYRVHVERVVRQNSPAAQWTDETRYQLLWSVQSVDTTGTAEVAQTLSEVRETLRWGESEPVEYDSTSKQEIHGDTLNFARHWQPQLNSERRFRLSPLGQWLAAVPTAVSPDPSQNPGSSPGLNPGGGAAGEAGSSGAVPSRGAATSSGESAGGVASAGTSTAGVSTGKAGNAGAATSSPMSATPSSTGSSPSAAPSTAIASPKPASSAPGSSVPGSSVAVGPPASGSAPIGNPTLPSGVRPIYCVLPTGPLQMGTQWTETHTMPQGDRPDAWQLTTAFTYVGQQELEDRSLHRIDVECRWRSAPPASATASTPTPSPGSSLVLERQEGTGQILFDQEAGHMTSSQLSQELITRTRRPDGTTFQSEIVTTVRLRIEPVVAAAAPQPSGIEDVEPPPTVSPASLGPPSPGASGESPR